MSLIKNLIISLVCFTLFSAIFIGVSIVLQMKELAAQDIEANLLNFDADSRIETSYPALQSHLAEDLILLREDGTTNL